MKHHRLLSQWGGWILLGAVLAALMIAPAIAFGQTGSTAGGAATGSTASGGNAMVSSPAVTADAAAAVDAYWTPERMKSAIPLDMGINKSDATRSAASGSGADGPAMGVAGSAPGAAEASAPQKMDLVGSAVEPAAAAVSYYAYQFPFIRSAVYPVSLYTLYPWSTNGKLFFSQRTAAGAILNFVCSGTSVTTSTGGNNGLVVTAGHCSNSGVNFGNGVPNGQWATNVRFCPAYYNGSTPFGCWTARQLWAYTAWTASGNLRYDYSMILTQFTSTTGRGRLGATVGTQGTAWNQPRANNIGGDWWAFGYPAASPFNGATQWFCASSIAVQDAPNAMGGPFTNGIGCDMTGGSSGGGWVLKARMEGPGYVTSVNSYKYINPAQPNAMYGPYFDTSFYNLWNLVRVK